MNRIDKGKLHICPCYGHKEEAEQANEKEEQVNERVDKPGFEVPRR